MWKGPGIALLVMSALLMAVGSAPAQTLAQTPAARTSPATQHADRLRAYVVTIGPGTEVWEKFGHNMLWIHDPLARVGGPDVAYNWGMFDFGPDYPFHFIGGTLRYWMAAYRAPELIQDYIDDDRSVTKQELNLTQPEIEGLLERLEWNRLPENKYYAYDYYTDNCSTRVRDAINTTLNGAIKKQLESKSAAAGVTYRWHTRRLLADDWSVDLALDYVCGPFVDHQLSEWQECFLPVQMRRHLREVRINGQPLVLSETVLHTSKTIAERSTPPSRFWPYFLIGLAIGLIIATAGRMKNAWVRRSALALAMLWCLLGTLASLLLLFGWFFTRHIPPKWDQNVLQLSPILLLLLILIPLSFKPRFARWAAYIACVIAALSIFGILLKVLPAQHQANADIIALALTINLGIVWAVWPWRRPELKT